MTVFPVFIDCRPAYLRETHSSLLRMPLGMGSILKHVSSHLSRSLGEPTILTRFEPDKQYEAACRTDLPELTAVVPARRFRELLDHREPSDWLLLIDPAHFPRGGFEATDMSRTAADPRAVTHWVAGERGGEGAQEHVLLDADGRVRRIQRYYTGITWVATCLVSSSLAAVAALRRVADRSFDSLAGLRQALTAYSIPSRDVQLSRGIVKLDDEVELLYLAEQTVLNITGSNSGNASAADGDRTVRGERCHVHESAVLRGPVVLQDNVSLEAGAVVIGPALLGSGCHVGANATVAQCLVASGAAIPACTTWHHRAILDDRDTCDAHAMDTKPQPRPARRLPLGTVAEPGSKSPRRERMQSAYPTFKRAVDLVAATLAIVLLGPLLLVIALLVKLTSKGPILFGHQRETVDGRGFRCWKFRTMVEDAHAQQRQLYEQNQVDGPQFKLQRDPRITRIGTWLRSTNIDELPQLINVVLGDMTLIGPRPSPFRENQICVAWRQARLSVRPGITGLWQLCRSSRGAGDFHQWIYYDTLYTRQMSFMLDLKILLATVLTLGGRWTVPVQWFIPETKLRDLDLPVLPQRAPILGVKPLIATQDRAAPAAG